MGTTRIPTSASRTPRASRRRRLPPHLVAGHSTVTRSTPPRPATGHSPVSRLESGPAARTEAARHLEGALGDDLGIRVSGAHGREGHFLLATDVRGEGADRRYLLSDPSSGRTAWVRDADLRTPGTPVYANQLGLGWDRMSTCYHPR